MERRSFLKRASIGAAGSLTALSTASASETRSFGSVTVRDHYEVNPFFQTSLADGYTEYGFDTERTIPGYTTEDSPDEILVWPNAWQKPRESITERFPQYQDSLDQAGYDAPSIVFEWDSNDSLIPGIWQENLALWRVTTYKATQVGKKLGQFLKEYRAQNPETTIRLTGFSLGAQVALSAIKSLDDRGWEGEIDSLALMGGAVQNDTVALGGEYGPACESLLGELDNFYKSNDQALNGLFTVAGGNPAIGQAGITGTAPDNYEQHQVDYVDAHDYYWSYEKGCIEAVVDEWAAPDA